MRLITTLLALSLAASIATAAKHRPLTHPVGTRLYMFACDGEKDQEWTVTSKGEIKANDGKCIDVDNWSKENGARAQLWDCHPESRPENQQWTFDRYAQWTNILTKLDNKHGLDIDGISRDEGAIIHMWEFLNQDNQLWSFNETDGTIRSKLNGLCLTVGWHYQEVPTCTDPTISSFAYCNKALTAEQRAADLLGRMTQDEKLAMVRGYPGPYVGNVRANARLGIPAIFLQDGPQGVAAGQTGVTCFPSALAVVSTWNKSTFRFFGEVQAEEQVAKGSNILLGPMHNLARVPVGGRNFESAGEDPYLGGVFAAAVVKGIQSKGIMACSKHFAANNHEIDRAIVSTEVDERTLQELYYPQFRATVDAGAASIMCSYNKINGTYACEHDKALNQDLKKNMGYKYFVMSDWGATHSTVLAANSGLDMQMPDAYFFGDALKKAIADGKVTEGRLDDMVKRIVMPMFALGMFDRKRTGDIKANVTSDAHNKVARDIAVESTVLVKNNGVLPMSTKPFPVRIAVIGMAAQKSPLTHGGGSGSVVEPYVITMVAGIRSRVGGNATVMYADGSSLQEAAAIAASADVAIVAVSSFSTEGEDRANLSLLDGQDSLVEAVIARQPRTVIVVNTAGAVLMPWANSAAAILVRVMPGQEDGNALAAVLFGDANPSGKLPISFPASEHDTWLQSETQYPGVNNRSYYSEKLLVGYRWYTAQNIAPLWPFGHGLSYTNFEYKGLTTSASAVSFTLTNVGKVAGAEVAQLYLGFPKSAGEPPKVLRAFEKVMLQPGSSKIIKFPLVPKDMAIWDVDSNSFVAVHGTFTAFVGSSSADIRLQGTFTN